MSRRKHRKKGCRGESPGMIAEREFLRDLYELLWSEKIRDLQRNKKLDQRGVDALVIRHDGARVKINVLVNTPGALHKHRVINQRLAKKDPMRRNILLWQHDRNLNRPSRIEALLKAIEEHNPDAE